MYVHDSNTYVCDSNSYVHDSFKYVRGSKKYHVRGSKKYHVRVVCLRGLRASCHNVTDMLKVLPNGIVDFLKTFENHQ